MQTIASYILEYVASNPHDAHARFDEVSRTIKDWLSEKKVSNPDDESGKFVSKTQGQEGFFRRVRLDGTEGRLEETFLSEPTFGGQIFTTRISLAQSATGCTVYSTLTVANTETIIAPFAISPRCPAVLRKLVDSSLNWVIAGDSIEPPTLNKFSGPEEADLVVAEILRSDRRLPIVVVSELDGEPIWPGITKELAFDLTGLAKVFQIDEAAAWRFTEALGKINSCYLGAIRLYWPPRGPLASGSVPPNRVWTASALMSDDIDGSGMNRFRALVRSTLMGVAALTVEPPRLIREIYASAQRKRISDLEATAADKSEELEIAKSYLDDNEKLQDEIDRLKKENAGLVARAEAAEYSLMQAGAVSGTAASAEPAVEDVAPEKGEIRYYKKTFSKPGYDVLVRVSDCGHSSWQNAAKADKAKKGVEKVEGRNDWSRIHHCGTCTGGGMWRVKW